MEIVFTWGLALQTGSFLLTVGLLIYNFLTHQKLTGNDLKHLTDNVKKISDFQDKQDTKIDTLCVDMAFIKGKNEVHKSIVEVLQKSLNK